MKIAKDAMVSMEYTLKIESGEVIDQSPADQPLSFIFGGGQIVPGLESALEGNEIGTEKQVTVEAKDGYGEAQEELNKEIPLDNFPEDLDLKEGSVFDAQTPHGPVVFTVKEVRDDAVIADFNHPLAGQKLFFDVKIVDVREATEEEMAALSSGCCGSHDHQDENDGCGGCSGHC